MANLRRIVIVILVVIIAVIVSLVIWGMIVVDAQENCKKHIDAIKNNPDGLIAESCRNWGFTIDPTDSSLP